MRIGVGTTLDHTSPEDWADTLAGMGCTAAVSPFDTMTAPDLRTKYLAQAERRGLCIGEVGVWKNVMSPDPDERRRSIRYAKDQLALAEDIGARCCVNISGNASTGGWDQYSPENYSEAAYDRIVETTQKIIDAVNPRHTTYAIECMPWMVPDSPEQYLQLMHDIDRPSFAVHLDYTNMINGMPRWRQLPEFIAHCFDLLGPYITSVHVKDIQLQSGLPTSIIEVQPGTGGVDFDMVFRHLAALPEDTTVYVEHLPDRRAYAAAMEFVRGIAPIPSD